MQTGGDAFRAAPSQCHGHLQDDSLQEQSLLHVHLPEPAYRGLEERRTTQVLRVRSVCIQTAVSVHVILKQKISERRKVHILSALIQELRGEGPEILE